MWSRGGSGSLGSSDDSASCVQQALIWVRKAKAGSIQWVDRCAETQFFYYRLSKQTKSLGIIAKYGLLLCTLFDMPSWCRGTPDACSTYLKQLYSPSFPVLTHRAGAGISIFLWAILAGRIYLRKLALGTAYTLTQWRIFTALIVSVGGLSALISVFLPIVYDLSVICRPFAFLACSKQLRKGFTNIVISVPGFLDVLFSLVICVFIGTWMAMVLFARSPEGEINFWSWRQGLTQMWILYTLNNTQSIILPAYNENKAWFWFFFAYLLLTFYFLGYMLLAKVYNTYKLVLKNEYKQYSENQEVSLKRAFTLLSDGVIASKTWNEFFYVYCDHYLGGVQVGDVEDRAHNLHRANKILKEQYGIHMPHDHTVNFESFKQIMRVFFDNTIYIAQKHGHAAADEFRFEIFRSINHVVVQGYRMGDRVVTWDGTMDCVIGLGALCVFYESWVFAHTYNVSKTYVSLMNRPAYWVLFSCSLIYVFGISMRISSLGIERFWQRKPVQNRIDFFLVYTLVVIELLYMLVWPTVWMMRMIMLFHIFRAWRLVRYIGPLQQLFLLMQRLMPVYWRMSMILFIVYWIFCDIGQLFFGGLIYTSNPDLVGTTFASSDNAYWELNFNCFLDGMMTLFVLMIMNNWNDISGAYIKASHSYVTQGFFLAFTIIANLVVLNILIALIIEGTSALSEEIIDQKDAQEHVPVSMEFGKSQTLSYYSDMEKSGHGMAAREAVFRKIFDVDAELSSTSNSESESTSVSEESGSGDDQAVAQSSALRTKRSSKKKLTAGLGSQGKVTDKLTIETQKHLSSLGRAAPGQKRQTLG